MRLPGDTFTCFTGTKVQMLTLMRLPGDYRVNEGDEVEFSIKQADGIWVRVRGCVVVWVCRWVCRWVCDIYAYIQYIYIYI